jgi:hypothetical protein
MNYPTTFNKLHQSLERNKIKPLEYNPELENQSYIFLQTFIDNFKEGQYYLDFINNDFQEKIKIPYSCNPKLENFIRNTITKDGEKLTNLGLYLQRKFWENNVKFYCGEDNLYNQEQDYYLIFQKLKLNSF